MKIRREISGLHFYDRKNGSHVLLDEVQIAKEQLHKGPRNVSIALTNLCNLECGFCYAPKHSAELPLDYLVKLVSLLENLGVLDISLGGGEPTLYKSLSHFCEYVSDKTQMGLSITTHGHNLPKSKLDCIARHLSILRFSIDGTGDRYESVRGRKLTDLLPTIRISKNYCPIGINCVASANRAADLKDVMELAVHEGITDVLIIPEHEKGIPKLNDTDWRTIESIICSYQKQLRVSVSYNASPFIRLPLLETAHSDEFLFCHVTADMKLQLHSYGGESLDISKLDGLEQKLAKFNPTTKNENLDFALR